jgi:hypothetical protein
VNERKEQTKKLKGLEEEIRLMSSLTGEESVTKGRLDMIRRMHKAVMYNVGNVKTNFSEAMKSQERDLLRTFESRLASVKRELEGERELVRKLRRRGKGDRERELEKELVWTKDIAKQLETSNDRLSKHNKNIILQLRQMKEDRSVLCNQLLVVKKENKRIRSECLNLREKVLLLQQRQVSSDVERKEKEEEEEVTSSTSSSSSEEKLNKIIAQQQKEIERSKKRVRELQRVHIEEKRDRSELESLLRTCLNDVKREIADRSILPPSDIDSIELKKSDDRNRVLKMLLSKRHVIELLYEKTVGSGT